MTGRLIIGIFLILLGISALTGYSFFQFFFALLLVVIGLRLIVGRTTPRHSHEWGGPARQMYVDTLNEVVVLSSLNRSVTSTNFQGGKVVTILAGGVVDLSQAKTESKEIFLETTAILGGIKIVVPKEWKVDSRAAAVLGGVDNRTAPGGDVQLHVTGAAILGGIEIVN
jgi:predicted membrane protein